MKTHNILFVLLIFISFVSYSETSSDVKLDKLIKQASKEPIQIITSDTGAIIQICEVTRWLPGEDSECRSLNFITINKSNGKTTIKINRSLYSSPKVLKARLKIEDYLTHHYTHCETQLSDPTSSSLASWAISCTNGKTVRAQLSALVFD